MGESYQIGNPQGLYFLTFQVVGWADVFTRKIYRDILIDSFDFCRKQKGLKLHAYVIMSTHVHCILCTENNLSDIVRDFKKHTSKTILKQIENPMESRREWLKLVFKYHAKYNKRVRLVQFWRHENHTVELSSNEMIDSRNLYSSESCKGWNCRK